MNKTIKPFLSTRRSLRTGVFAFSALAIVIAAASIIAPRVRASSSLNPLSGYAWSSTIGWIDMSGVSEDPTTGYLSGYAWASTIGWISFNWNNSSDNFTSCPAGTTAAACQPMINLTTGALSGFAKATAANEAQSGGWDGYIGLSGVTDPPGQLSGYAWGSTVVGWVDMSGVSVSTATCPTGEAYSNGTCVSCGGSPAGCTGAGGTATNPTGSLVCSDGATNPPTCDTFASCNSKNTSDNCSLPGTPSGGVVNGPYCSSGYTGTCDYTCNNGTWTENSPSTCTAALSCTSSTAGGGTCTSLPTPTPSGSSASGTCVSGYTGAGAGDSCSYTCENGVWTLPYSGCTPLPPATVTISASPTRVKAPGSSTIIWSASSVTGCSITKNGSSSWTTKQPTSSEENGTPQTITDNGITSQSIYVITCTGQDGGTAAASTTVNIVPIFQEF